MATGGYASAANRGGDQVRQSHADLLAKFYRELTERFFAAIRDGHRKIAARHELVAYSRFRVRSPRRPHRIAMGNANRREWR